MKYGLAMIAAASALTMSSLASAQMSGSDENTQQPQYFSARIGGLFPFDRNLRDQSDLFLGVGIDFTFSDKLVKNGETYVSADWLATTSGGNRFDMFPLCINERFFLNQRTEREFSSQPQTYVYVGVGEVLFDASPSTWRFGGRAGVGANFGNNFFAEGGFFMSMPLPFNGNPTWGARCDAAGLYVGYKFKN